MKKWIFFIFILILAILEATFLDSFKIFGVKPNLLLIGVVIAGLILEFKWSFSLSVFAGILKDALLAHPLGINTLFFPLWIFLILKLSWNIPLDNNPIRMLTAGVILVLHNLLPGLIFFALGNSLAGWGIFLCRAFWEVSYSLIILFFVFKIISPYFIASE